MSKKIKSFLDRNALALAMVVGVAGFPVFRHLTGILPPMIFLMLFFTFCKINPADLRLRAWHWVVLGCQLLLGVGTYYGVMAIGDWVLAMGEVGVSVICVLSPTTFSAYWHTGKRACA